MTLSAAVVTTFPDNAFDVYGRRMLQSFMQFWPAEVPILIGLDDDLLLPDVNKLVRPQDAVAWQWSTQHAEFIKRNTGKDDAQNYRKQPVRFCHKVFIVARAWDAMCKQKAAGEITPRYLIWMDADVLTTRKVELDEIQLCLPKEGDVAATLQRKDWPHSECGWIAFDLENKGGELIEKWFKMYESDAVLSLEQQHDSWAFDVVVKENGYGITNLCQDAPGLDVWQFTPMAKWSRHYKGPLAKQELMASMPKPQQQGQQSQKVVIQTKNAIPHEEICAHIEENQKLITRWVRPCEQHDEEIVVVSAGPQLYAEDVRDEVLAGRKIVAVKHAIEPLRQAGIKPWACILLDPRPHVNNFVKDPDRDIIWFVASQVNPEVTKALLSAGCTVWGYHAAVGAGEVELTKKQTYATVTGGSATATRGLFLLNHLGFHRFRLYGYDLCYPDKPDMNLRDQFNQPKYMEISIGFMDKYMNSKRHFWTEPQLIAQYEEINEIIKADKFELEAFGDGIVPYIVKCKKVSNLRNREEAAKILGDETPHYMDVLGCRTSRTYWPKWLQSSRRKRKSGSRF